MRNHPPVPIRNRTPKRDRAAAILIVLAVMAILSVLVLGFVSSMTTDLKASHSMEVNYRTKMVAHGALSHGIELLRSNIPDPAPITATPKYAPARSWATNPGRLTVITESGTYRTIDLHSGAAADPGEDEVFDARSTDLNRPIPGTVRAPIASSEDGSLSDRPEMRVAWVPVLADPSKPAGPGNRLTGRYAFWIDDESSKLNASVALGKPNLEEDEAVAEGFENWKQQLASGKVTPRFQLNASIGPNYGGGPRISLGHPWSVNFDALFEDEELPVNLVKLYHESRVHGFHRYPDAILKFVELPPREKRQWYDRNLWHMTFYSRSPEFNAFGFSRLFTLNSPATLPGGPAYQMPFSSKGTTYTQALFGFPSSYGTLPEDSELKLQMNDLTLDSGRTLMQYLNRRWPGQPGSLIDKYGGDECRQIALNLLMMSRFATARVFGADDYARLTTSLNYQGEARPESTIPDRDYWYLNDDFEVDFTQPPMLPQTPGPHINEIKFVVEPIERFVGNKRVIYLRYHYEVEYYLHPEHPLGPFFPPGQNQGGRFPFPVKVDYLKLEANEHTQVFDQPDWDSDNLRKLQPRPSQPARIGSRELNYQVVRSPSFFVSESEDRVGEGGPVAFDPLEEPSVSMKVNLRLGLGISTGSGVKEMVPLGTEPEDTLEAEFDLNLAFFDPETFVSWEIEDPRIGWNKEDWLERENEDSMGKPNSNQPQDPVANEYSTFKYVQLPGFLQGIDGARSSEDEYEADTRFPSAGYLSMIHTGIRNREPWRTLSLKKPEDGDAADWVLLDLIGPTYPIEPGTGVYSRSLPDHWMGLSYMNATAGKVNLNNKVYPDNDWFNPPERTKPLKGVFRYLREDDEIDILIQQILDYQSDSQIFESIGDLTEIGRYEEGETDWEKEALLRNLASCLTTQSNTFGIWGNAQTVAKSRGSTDYGNFEAGDTVLGEKRFFALVERYVWPGRDGIPGNAHVDSGAMWDRLAEPQTELTDTAHWPGSPPQLSSGGKFDVVDGPSNVSLDFPELMAEVPYESSSLAEADNPPHAVVKYRVLYFRYLDH